MDPIPLTNCRGTSAVLVDCFYKAAISSCDEYRRAAAYFTSSVFSACVEEYNAFLRLGGRMELVAGRDFDRRDVDAILSALTNPGTWASRSAEDLPRSGGGAGEGLLAWGMATGRVHIKIALVKHQPNAIYHEKFGIFLRKSKPVLAFEGSFNETYSALCSNFERAAMYHGDNSASRDNQRRLLYEFDRLWHNDTPGLTVIPVYSAIQAGLLRIRRPQSQATVDRDEQFELAMSGATEFLKLPDRLTLRDYQEAAIASWFRSQGVGVFEMATGAGKTLTALAAFERLYREFGGPLVVIVVAPYIHLVDQWASEATAFGLSPICCYGSWTTWYGFAQSAIYRSNRGDRSILSMIVTNATFCTERFQRLVSKINVRTVLVADEVHNLGAPRLAKSLPSRVSLRMGLSATPTRWRDQHGTDRLAEYFGPVVFKFGLEEALRSKPPVLVPYRYHPLLVQLEDDEQEEYLELTAAIGRCMSNAEDCDLSELAKRLLIRRSRVLAAARQKLKVLKQVISPHRFMLHTLVYCGDASVEFSDSDEQSTDDSALVRQVDAVTRILGTELGMAVAQFTAATGQSDREHILRSFQNGQLQALVAIRCLDEGVNLPIISRAFILASSTNPRQFIQRRGRVLRRAEGKDSADIYDFVVRPPKLTGRSDPAFATGRRLVESEMRRVVEFGRLAINAAEARHALQPVLKDLDLLHIW